MSKKLLMYLFDFGEQRKDVLEKIEEVVVNARKH
jgi:hypothetical protein